MSLGYCFDWNPYLLQNQRQSACWVIDFADTLFSAPLFKPTSFLYTFYCTESSDAFFTVDTFNSVELQLLITLFYTERIRNMPLGRELF